MHQLTKLIALALGLNCANGMVFDASTVCISHQQPNPLANLVYPATGTTNGTVTILPIKYEVARKIVPAEYPILKEQYQQWLPNFPKDMFPAMLQAEWNTGIVLEGTPTPSWNFSRASIFFPFVDRLKDGHTSFAYLNKLLLGAKADGVHEALGAFGIHVSNATFDPACNAYNFADSNHWGHSNTPANKRPIYMNAFVKGNSKPSIGVEMTPVDKSPYPIGFYYNITNHPQFSYNHSICDQQVRLLNTTVSQGKYAPVNVQGNVWADTNAFVKDFEWKDTYGLKLDQAFYETRGAPCNTMGGFSVNCAPGDPRC